MLNYSNSSIYKLCCLDPLITDIYIGSTINYARRKNGHKGSCNNKTNKNYDIYVYRFIRDNGGWGNWDMVEIERYNAADKLDLHKRERHWIETLLSTLNKSLPAHTITNKEYYVLNKPAISQKNREWKERHKVSLKKHNADYYTKNKDTIREAQRIYRDRNKDKIREQKAKAYLQNKDTIRERQRIYRGRNLMT
jgi:hypothetical protein